MRKQFIFGQQKSNQI